MNYHYFKSSCLVVIPDGSVLGRWLVQGMSIWKRNPRIISVLLNGENLVIKKEEERLFGILMNAMKKLNMACWLWTPPPSLALCRSAPAGHRVVQGRRAHRPGEVPQVPGAGGRQPAGQRPPARRHRHVPVLCQKCCRRSPDQHVPGCYQWALRQLLA